MDGIDFNIEILERAKKHYIFKMKSHKFYNLDDCIDVFWDDYFKGKKLYA